MTLSQLHTFLVVCEKLSFTEAAKQLSLSQPAVSRQISAMETEIGTALFTRDHSVIALTDAGRHLHQRLDSLYPDIMEALSETKRVGQGEKGRLRIGLLEDQCLDSTISAALRTLKEENIHLSIQRFDFQQLEEKLLNGEIDLAISIEQYPEAFSGCLRKLYARECMCLALHKDYLVDGNVELDSLSCPILVPSLDSFRKNQYQALSSMYIQRWQGSQEYDFSSIAPMVAAGLAATLANESHNLSVDQSVVLLPIEEIPGVSKGVFWIEKNTNPMIGRLVAQL